MHSSQAEDDEESSSDGTDGAANGLLPPHHLHHPRSASASVPDVRRPAVTRINEKKRDHHRVASGSRPQQQAPTVNSLLHPPGSASVGGASPHTAKETFLNYFFGGPNGTGPPGQVSSAPGSAHGNAHAHGADRRLARPPPSVFQEKELLPDLGTRRASGRTSLDSRQAFDMKSLGKHIEVR